MTKATGKFPKVVVLLYHKTRQVTLGSVFFLHSAYSDVKCGTKLHEPTPTQLTDPHIQAYFRRGPAGLGRKEKSCPQVSAPPLSSASEPLHNHVIPKAPPKFRILEFHLEDCFRTSDMTLSKEVQKKKKQKGKSNKHKV